ncbi:haloalkane dehalogenase [Nocardia sp. CA-120079]|uniref:haloalkane dehalogenase n=1 Tax=Nocardia sp. CA-120079 TaxID=3239974 RepID=UPI003D97283F
MPIQQVLDSTIFHREMGAGTPFVFLHGNPTSSYLWRNVLPAVDDPARRLAPDLIGMGDSGKPDIDYTFDDHARYLDAWFDALELDSVVLIGHDWGGALAFDWAARHPDRVRGVAFFETIVKPMSWEEFPDDGRRLFEAIKTPGIGEAMLLEQNAFIELLPGTVITPLTEEDLAAYREPYPTLQSRRPLLQWARSMPLGGEPADVVARVEAYDAWLATSVEVPKLLLAFEPGPGAMQSPEMVDWCATHIANLEITRHGPAGHHTPEDQPTAIATAIAAWADKHNLRSTAES